jgi:hypothetical protein
MQNTAKQKIIAIVVFMVVVMGVYQGLRAYKASRQTDLDNQFSNLYFSYTQSQDPQNMLKGLAQDPGIVLGQILGFGKANINEKVGKVALLFYTINLPKVKASWDPAAIKTAKDTLVFMDQASIPSKSFETQQNQWIKAQFYHVLINDAVLRHNYNQALAYINNITDSSYRAIPGFDTDIQYKAILLIAAGKPEEAKRLENIYPTIKSDFNVLGQAKINDLLIHTTPLFKVESIATTPTAASSVGSIKSVPKAP